MSRVDIGLSAEQVRKQCDASLSRLGTDYIDLYQCHRFDTRTPLSETMAALTELVQAGKVRHLGFSEWSPEQIEAAAGLPGVARFTSSQPQYSMLWRRPEQEVFPLCRKLGIGQIVYSPLAQGVLSGKYRPGEPPAPQTRAGGKSTGRAMASYARDEVLAAVHRLRPVAAAAGVTMSQLALAWVLRHDVVASAITGATSPEQVRQNAGGPGEPLGDDVLRAIDDAVRDVAA
jgi:aryl-alcohol dehydrogenase-like predicted oxidoreductase